MTPDGLHLARMAKSATVREAEKVLAEIYREDPSYWPHGLSLRHFRPGDLYLIRADDGKTVAGFVGWQLRKREGKTVGYYAVGVRPEYRRQGLAKRALTNLFRERGSECDEIRALVAPHNMRSQRLAKNMKIPIEKSAALSPGAAHALKMLLGAGLTTAVYDQIENPDRTLGDTAQFWNWDKSRALGNVLTAGAGALAGSAAHSHDPKGAVGAVLLAGLKQLTASGNQLTTRLNHALPSAERALEEAAKPKPDLWSRIPKGVLAGTLGGGAALAGLYAYAMKRQADAAAAQAEAARGGRVKVTLPTKNPGDSETVIDVPIEELSMSNALRTSLGRDTRRRLYEETRQRTRRRKPANPQAPTEAEAARAALDEEYAQLDKTAALIVIGGCAKLAAAQGSAPAPTAPTPPPLNVNPAMRQMDQRVAVQSIDTSTQANPSIMAAQQAAGQAEAQAQQQVAEAQQSQQQELMQMQQKFNEQMASADEARMRQSMELETMKLKLEAEKVRSNLAETKAKADREIADAKAEAAGQSDSDSMTQVGQLISSRLSRLAKKLNVKSAAAPMSPAAPPAPPVVPPTPPVAAPMPQIAPGSVDQVNRVGASSTAAGLMAPAPIFRASLGNELLDKAYNRMVAAPVYAPKFKLSGMPALTANDPFMYRRLMTQMVGLGGSPTDQQMFTVS